MNVREELRAVINDPSYLDSNGVDDTNTSTTINGNVPDQLKWFGMLLEQGIATDMRSKIDPLYKQAENLGEAATKASLGLESLTEMEKEINKENEAVLEEELAELEELDNESRHMDFTPEEVGLFTTDQTYALTREQAWLGIELHNDEYQKLSVLATESFEQARSLLEYGLIDQSTAMKIKDRIPNALNEFTESQFTKRRSKVNYNLACEDVNNQQAIVGGIAALGGLLLLYKVLSWSSNILSNNPTAVNSIRKNVAEAVTRSNRLKEDSRNIEELLNALNNNEERLLGVIKEENGQQIIDSIKGDKNALHAIVDAKWSKGKEFRNLCNGFLKIFIDDNGSKSTEFGKELESLAKDMVGGAESILSLATVIANKGEGESVNNANLVTEVNSKIDFINRFANRMNIDIDITDASNVDKVKIVTEWFNKNLLVIDDWYPTHAPSIDMLVGFGTEAFEEFNVGFAKNIDKGRDTIRKIISDEKANNKDKDNKNQSFKIVSDAYLALTGLLRAIIKFRNWIGQILVKENSLFGRLLGIG